MRSQRFIAAIVSALALTACGGDEVVPGGPAPPAAGDRSDCEELGRAGPQANDARWDGRPPYGFNDHAGLVGSIPIAEDAALQERAGSGLWRVAIDWRFAEPEPGEISLETHDAIYCEALAHGIRPVFHVTGAPEWAAEAGECPVPSCLQPPRAEALGELADFAELVARRYPAAAAIEAWNEPNLATFWAEPDPERYVEVLRAIHDGVKAAEPEMPVLGGSLSNTGRTDATRFDFGRFLEGMHEAGAARYMDALAFHPYPVAPLGTEGERFTSSMERLRETKNDAREEDEPIWVTEVGLPVGGGVSPEDQARTMAGIYERLAADRDVDAVIFHTLLEGTDAGAGDGFGWLVVGEDGEISPRPVFRTFARGRG